MSSVSTPTVSTATDAARLRGIGPIPYWQMSGSGNDFVVVDNRGGAVPPGLVAAFARAVCRRGLAVGVDGLVLIGAATDRDAAIGGAATDTVSVDGGDAAVDRDGPGQSGSDGPPPAFRWRYVNADGSDGAFCGNGAMCAARFAVLQRIAPRRCAFWTAGSIVEAEVSPDPADPTVRVTVPQPSPVGEAVRLGLPGWERVGALWPVTVGVPHAVCVVPSVAALDTAEGPPRGGRFVAFGRAVRHHPAFAPAGTNLDAVEVVNAATIRLRTYERGVEDETLACGSGAVAAALVATAGGHVAPPVDVIVASGLRLRVGFDWDPGARRGRGGWLRGAARVVARGTIDPEAFG